VSCRPGGRALPGGGAASTRRRICGTSRTAFAVSWPTAVEQNTSDGLIKEESRKGAFFDYGGKSELRSSRILGILAAGAAAALASRSSWSVNGALRCRYSRVHRHRCGILYINTVCGMYNCATYSCNVVDIIASFGNCSNVRWFNEH